jgi:hypothetical protein
MLTLSDCLEFCGLTEEEILAIAEHENLDEMAAVCLGSSLAQTPEGEVAIERMILDDIRAAHERGELRHEDVLKAVLQHFRAGHPHAPAK